MTVCVSLFCMFPLQLLTFADSNESCTTVKIRKDNYTALQRQSDGSSLFYIRSTSIKVFLFKFYIVDQQRVEIKLCLPIFSENQKGIIDICCQPFQVRTLCNPLFATIKLQVFWSMSLAALNSYSMQFEKGEPCCLMCIPASNQFLCPVSCSIHLLNSNQLKLFAQKKNAAQHDAAATMCNYMNVVSKVYLSFFCIFYMLSKRFCFALMLSEHLCPHVCCAWLVENVKVYFLELSFNFDFWNTTFP